MIPKNIPNIFYQILLLEEYNLCAMVGDFI